MTKYDCDKCYKNFDNKIDYIRHINKKKDCTIKNDYFTCDKCYKQFIYKSHYDRHIDNKFSCSNNEIIHDKGLKKFQCMKCYKWYATKRSLRTHQYESCKLYENKNNMIEIIDNLKKELEKKNKIINNINNYSTINTSVVNNTNIIINAYGKEDLSYITDNDYKSLFNKCNSAIPLLIDLIHYNEKHTENANVYISNMKSQYAYIYDGTKWILKNKDELIDDIYDNKCVILLEKYDDLKNILNDLTVRHFEYFRNKYDSSDMKKNVSNKIELLLYNNRTLIKK